MKFKMVIFFILCLFTSCYKNIDETNSITQIQNKLHAKEYDEALLLVNDLQKKQYEYYNLKGQCYYFGKDRFGLQEANKNFFYAYLYNKNDLENILLLANSYFDLNDYKKVKKFYLKLYNKYLVSKNKNIDKDFLLTRIALINFIEKDYNFALENIANINKNNDEYSFLQTIQKISNAYLFNSELKVCDFNETLQNIDEHLLCVLYESLIPKYMPTLKDLVLFQNNRESIKNVNKTFLIYILTYEKDYKTANTLLEELTAKNVTITQLDKVKAFYYYATKNYTKANWFADFYFFKFYSEQKRKIKVNQSKNRFKRLFKNDAMFICLRDS